MLDPSKRLSEEVCLLVLCMYIDSFDEALLNLLSDEMTIDFYVLCSFVEDWID